MAGSKMSGERDESHSGTYVVDGLLSSRQLWQEQEEVVVEVHKDRNGGQPALR